MLKKSAGIYVFGFLFGVLSSMALISFYPSLYHAFLDFLRAKMTAQGRIIPNLALMIIANNLIAAYISSFGGTMVSKIVNVFDGETAKNKALLYFLPVGILFVNGEVLGLLAVLYKEQISLYLSGILPHGFFEIPAIILSGAMGLGISEKAQSEQRNYQANLSKLARKELRGFIVVVLMLIIGGLLEGGAL